MKTGGGSPHALVVESWIQYSIGMSLFFLRMYARAKRLGWGKWQIDDYLMCTAACWYTTFVITNILIAEGGGSSLYEPGDFETFTPEDIQARVLGSKIEIVSEQAMLNVIYTIKACMLFIYTRLTMNLKRQIYVKIAAVYAFCGWLATELVFFNNCRPFSGYWTLPPPQEECASYFRYSVTQAVFNISSDVVILLIVLPLLFATQMAWRQKIPLLVIFSMGSFVILAAVLTKIFTFHDVFDTSYQFWYLREASTAMYVSNFPLIWPLMRQTFPFLRTFNRPHSKNESHDYTSSSGNGQLSSSSKAFGLDRLRKSNGPSSRLEEGLETVNDYSRNNSEELIIHDGDLTNEEQWKHPDTASASSNWTEETMPKEVTPGNIEKKTEVQIMETNLDTKPSEANSRIYSWPKKSGHEYNYNIQGGSKS